MGEPQFLSDPAKVPQNVAGAAKPQPDPSANQPLRFERLVMLIWPSIGGYRLGRIVGGVIGLQLGWPPVFTLGNIFAILLIPFVLILYFSKYLPGRYRRYLVTTGRVAIQNGFTGQILRAVEHDRWDCVDVEYIWGQKPLRCADLVFSFSGEEVFRLPGVPQPEAYCHAIAELKATLTAFRPLLEGTAASPTTKSGTSAHE